MDRINFDPWVVIAATNGEKFFGKISEKSPITYMNDHTKNKDAVVLEEARLMLTQYGATKSPDGQMSSIQTTIALIPIDMNNGPVKGLRIVPSSWYFPSQDTWPKLEKLIRQAEHGEMANKAAQHGIVLPGTKQGGPGGTLVG